MLQKSVQKAISFIDKFRKLTSNILILRLVLNVFRVLVLLYWYFNINFFASPQVDGEVYEF